MSRSLGLKCCVALLPMALGLISGGCEPVREDRTIEFSRDGKQVAFQHDREGVFIADSEGGQAIKIFQPDENVLATSRPLASPTDGRLLFATAQPLDETPPQLALSAGPVPAEGRIVSGGPIRFTCWLRDEPQADQPAEVKKLFTATCGHVGYVSAGLAVRWHPDGKHVLFITTLKDRADQHSIFEFDLESEQTRRVFSDSGHAILCDWTPNGSAMTCVVGAGPNYGVKELPTTDGIWIGKPGDDESWWHVPESESLSLGELPSMIEALRASRPAWTQDDSRFAFVSRVKSDPPDEVTKHRLHEVDYATRTIRTVTEAEGSFTDLHWSPDGRRLGFLTQPKNGLASLRILEPTGEISDVAADQSPRKFAGFDATGRLLAYISASPMDVPSDSPWWALLLIPDPLSRDTVWIADAQATDSVREIFSGLRVTFSVWSPNERRLSLWLTFQPRYRSLLSILRQWGCGPAIPPRRST